MVIASSAAPNQSHCCWVSGSSSFISPSVQSEKGAGARKSRSISPLYTRANQGLIFTFCRALWGLKGTPKRIAIL